VQVERLAEGLWWWTGRLEGRGDTGSLFVESEHAISLLDPVVPPEDRARFLRALDRDVERHGGPVHVFLSSTTKREPAAELIARYEAHVKRTATVDVEPFEAAMFWLPAHHTLFAADALVATADGTVIGTIPESLDTVHRIVCSCGPPVQR
jgi:hypothetical protein